MILKIDKLDGTAISLQSTIKLLPCLFTSSCTRPGIDVHVVRSSGELSVK